METHELLHKEHALLSYLNHLPRKMLSLPEQDNITEFVLHELCCPHCFDLKKAAYFVDNPEFNCLQGVVGLCRSQAYATDNIWDTPEEFSKHMRNASFNQQVRGMRKESLKKSPRADEMIAQEIARDLGFSDSGFFAWNGKYQNHGILIFERPAKNDGRVDAHFVNGVSLLSFCPLF